MCVREREREVCLIEGDVAIVKVESGRVCVAFDIQVTVHCGGVLMHGDVDVVGGVGAEVI